MTTANIIVLIVVIAACVGAIILLYFMGKRNMKKRDERAGCHRPGCTVGQHADH